MNSFLLAIFASFSTLAIAADDDYILYSPAAQAYVDSNACGRPLAERAVSKAIDIISDAGVDYPDNLTIEKIENIWEDKYRVSIADGFAMDITSDEGCALGEPTVLETKPGNVNYDSNALDQLAVVGHEVLGNEFFDYLDLGDAYRFSASWFSSGNGDGKSLVEAYYREWHGNGSKVTRQTDESEAAIRGYLAKMGVKAFDDQPETGAKAEEMVQLLAQALADKPRFKIFTGYSIQDDQNGPGDSSMDFVAIVDENFGEVLLLSQGVED